MRFIGDVQGQYERYKKIIAGAPRSIQVGDLGVGCRPLKRDDTGEYSEPPLDAMVRGEHRFIRGNHDNPATCRTHPQWIADGHFENGVMFLGGALSPLRVDGYGWWPDEELSAAELKRLCVLYRERKPRVMVTHDCPDEVASVLLARIPFLGTEKREIPSRTRYALQEMWSAHAPEVWIFGHYNLSFDQVLYGGRQAGTRFIGLADLEYREIDLP
jgi:hypothetical protein